MDRSGMFGVLHATGELLLLVPSGDEKGMAFWKKCSDLGAALAAKKS